MPFIKYGNVDHRCDPPNRREDGSALQTGDEWQCDADMSVAPNQGIFAQPSKCNKVWVWTQSHDQREPGNYWKHTTGAR